MKSAKNWFTGLFILIGIINLLLFGWILTLTIRSNRMANSFAPLQLELQKALDIEAKQWSLTFAKPKYIRMAYVWGIAGQGGEPEPNYYGLPKPTSEVRLAFYEVGRGAAENHGDHMRLHWFLDAGDESNAGEMIKFLDAGYARFHFERDTDHPLRNLYRFRRKKKDNAGFEEIFVQFWIETSDTPYVAASMPGKK